MLRAFKKITFLFIIVTIHTIVASTNNQIDHMLSTMNLRQKAGQMILVYNSPYEFLDRHNIGGVLIMQNMLKRPDHLKQEIHKKQMLMKIPLLIAIDQEGGTVNRLGYMPQWKHIPSAQAMAHWPEDSIRIYQEQIAQYLKSLGINLNLAPVLDPAKNHSGEQTYIDHKKRSYGSTSEEIVPPAKAFISAFSKNNIGCIVKHFPGYDVPVNSDYKIAVSSVDSQRIDQLLTPFQRLNANSAGIMMSSILYEKIGTVPAVFCPEIVRMARAISPNGIIVTDDLWGVALRSFTYPGQKIQPVSYPDSAFIRIITHVIGAGNDMLMITYPAKVPLIVDTIEKLAKKNRVIYAHVDAAVRRILSLKYSLHLFNERNTKLQ